MIISRNQLCEFAPEANISSSLNLTRRSWHHGMKASVFLSHKHDDLIELKRVAKLLEKVTSYLYVDWLDDSMPNKTCGETALIIKDKIKKYDKFILVATDRAIESKWCNWELGYGDSQKYLDEKIALFPIKQENREWSGSEYMQIYPTIEWFDGMTKNPYTYSYPSKGFYVVYNIGIKKIMPLHDWLIR